MRGRRKRIELPARRLAGLTVMELVVGLTVLAIVAGMVAVAGYQRAGEGAKARACDVQKREIEMQGELWYRAKGTWPARDLGDMGQDPRYFPAGVPRCPVDGDRYQLDPVTNRVVGHDH